jgi:hypothetical protein
MIDKVASENFIFNVFNPSIRIFNSKIYCTFRGILRNSCKKVGAWLLVNDTHVPNCRLIDLALYFNKFNIETTADPKLFEYDNALFLTFNTGWSRVENKVYLCRVSPELGEPLECVYPDRQRIEKNWGFFSNDGNLHALYSLHNGQVLKGHIIQSSNVVEFTNYKNIQVPSHIKGFAIGTQFLLNRRGLNFISHKKLYFGSKRLYLGFPVSLKIKTNEWTLSAGKRYLIHNFARLVFGGRNKLNKNLWSCTYFSGITEFEGRIVVSYGVNDSAFNFAYLDEKDFYEN